MEPTETAEISFLAFPAQTAPIRDLLFGKPV